MDTRSLLTDGKNTLLTRSNNRLTPLLASLWATLASRSKVRVSPYEGNWLHEWNAGRLVHTQPLGRPARVARQHIPLFTLHYLPQEGDVVMDVGAGVGSELAQFWTMVGPSGRLIAIEPDPAAVDILRLNAGIARCGHATDVLDVAVAAEPGYLQLSQDSPADIANTLLPEPEQGRESVTVRVRTLDSIVEELGLERIDYLKMNIEGAEHAALLGFEKHNQIVRNWCVSCHDFLGYEDARTRTRVIAWLTDHGFAVHSHPTDPKRPWAQDYVYATGHLLD